MDFTGYSPNEIIDFTFDQLRAYNVALNIRKDSKPDGVGNERYEVKFIFLKDAGTKIVAMSRDNSLRQALDEAANKAFLHLPVPI